MENTALYNIDLDEDVPIMLDDLNPDDLIVSEDELDGILNMEEINLARIPPITYIDDTDSTEVLSVPTAPSPSRSSPRKQVSCQTCDKKFKKLNCFVKHAPICRKKFEKLSTESKSQQFFWKLFKPNKTIKISIIL